VKLPTPLYYLGGTTDSFKEFWSQREHVARDKKWHYQRLWTDEQVVEMLKGMTNEFLYGRCRVHLDNVISQLRGGRDE